MIICIATLWYDAHRSSRDIVYQREARKRAYMERWQLDVGYAICIFVGGALLVQSTNKLRKP